VREEFEASAVLVLDGGPCKVGIESTVVSLLDVVAGTGGPKVLRPGVVSQKQIDRVARWKPRSASGGKENIKTKSARESKQARLAERRPASLGSAQLTAPLLSPGLLSKHYAPRIPLSVYPTLEALRAALRRADKCSPCLVIAHVPASDLEGALRKGDGFVAMPTSPSAYATALYEALHESLWFHRMLLLLPPTGATSRSKDAAVWDAVHDRLKRASAE
jgi:L-threonylcarbamoyladenylate synthase